MTRKEAHRYHRQLWNWLSRHPEAVKTDWPGWERHHLIDHYCFSCKVKGDETLRGYRTPECTTQCMLVWPGVNCCDSKEYNDSKGLFRRWCNAKTYAYRSKLAAEIRDMPLRVTKD